MPRVSESTRKSRARTAAAGRADFLRDGIYELRPSYAGVHYRILYFFAGKDAVVISHGLTKEAAVPTADIERAIVRRKKFAANPRAHTMGTEQ